MATVTKKFRDDFERWAARKVATDEWTAEEIEGLKKMLRRDLSPGPDQLRDGMTVINAAGIEVPAVIDNHEERYSLWAGFFATEASRI